MPIDNLSKITSRSGINTTILLEAGNANVTGIVTAAGFVGPFTGGGDVAAGIITGTGLKISGISTFTGAVFINRTSALGAAKLSITKDADQEGIGVQLNASSGITTSLMAYNSGGVQLFDLAHDTDSTPDLIFKLKHPSVGFPIERVRIASNGNVGISSNNSTPEALLDIKNVGTSVLPFKAYRNDVGDTPIMHLLAYNNTLGVVDKFVVTSRGRVGVNTDNPQREIHVKPSDNNPATAVPGYIRIEGQGANQEGVLELYHTRSNGSDKWPVSVSTDDAAITFNVANAANGTPDEKVRITSGGKVCIAHTNALHSGNLQVSTSGADAIDINSYSTSADNGGRLSFYRSKNASIGSNTIVADDDSLGRIDFRGYNTNGNSYDQGATIEARVDGSVNSSTDMPSAILFKTSADGSASPTERLRIASDGKVGIGTTNPTAHLQVYRKTAFASNPIIQARSNNGSTNELKFEIDGDGDAYFNGNIGINETNPSSIIHATGSDTSTGYQFINTHSTSGFGVFIKGGGSTADRYALRVDNAAGDEIFRVSANKRVGIGTAIPDQPLHLYTTEQNAIKWVSTNSDGPLVSYFHSSTHVGAIGNSKGVMSTTDVHFGVGSKSDLVFGTKPSGGGSTLERMRIKEDGEVHISDRNTSNTGDHFFQAGAFGIRMEDTGGYNRWNIERNYGGFKSTPVVHLSAQSRVGINTTSPEGTLDVTSEIGSEPLGAIFRKDYAGDTTDASHKVALTIWGMDHNDLDHTGQDAYGPMIGFGARNDRSAPNTGDVRAAISYRYNGNLTFHTEAGGSITDGSNESLRITSKGTTIAYHGAAPTDALTYSSSFRGREGVISPIYYWPRSYGAHSNGGGYDDVAEGGRLTLRLVGATGGTAAMFHGGFGITYGGGGEAIEYNRVRVIFRTSRANTTDGYSQNTITFKMQQYYYNGGWTDISNSAWNFDGTDSERGYRWTASNWISSADFAGGFDVPSIAIKYDTDNGNLSNANMRIAAVYLQYARFS